MDTAEEAPSVNAVRWWLRPTWAWPFRLVVFVFLAIQVAGSVVYYGSRILISIADNPFQNGILWFIFLPLGLSPVFAFFGMYAWLPAIWAEWKATWLKKLLGSALAMVVVHVYHPIIALAVAALTGIPMGGYPVIDAVRNIALGYVASEPTANVGPAPTPAWQHYVDEQHGFAVDVPTGWEIEVEDDLPIMHTTWFYSGDFSIAVNMSETMKGSSLESILNGLNDDRYVILKEPAPVSYHGQTAIRVVRQKIVDGRAAEYRQHEIVISSPDSFHILAVFGPPSSDEDSARLLDAALASFEVLE